MSALCGLDDCARPAPTATICEQHWWELDRALRSVPDLLAELDTSLSRMTRIGPVGEKVTGSGEKALAFGLGASDKGRSLREVLVAWARPLGAPWTEYATTAAVHLLDRLPDLRAYDQLPLMVEQVLEAHDAASRAVDAPAHRAIITIGACPEPACQGTVRAFIPADSRPPRMACDIGDGHWWGTAQWLRVGKRIRDRQGAA